MDEDKTNDAFKHQNKKKVPIIICGNEYLITASFSLNDLEYYQKSLKRGDTAKDALCNIIYGKLQKCVPPIPTPEEIRCESDSVFIPYISAVITSGDSLKAAYDETDITLSIFERFAIANEKCWKQCNEKSKKRINSRIKLDEHINRSVSNSFMQMQNQGWLSAATLDYQFSQCSQQTPIFITSIQNTIDQLSNLFSRAISNVHIQALTDERKQELEGSYRAWGRLGWTVIPYAPMKLFNNFPLDEKQANNNVLRYFNKEALEKFFIILREKHIKKRDLDSAVFCFENKQYKACAILLFSIIDAKLIGLQPKDSFKQVGERAIKALEKRLHEKADDESFLFRILYYLGLIESLSVFFENGKNFMEEPQVINRNFVCHGMNKRYVRKRDCIQLFVTLYNLVELLEII